MFMVLILKDADVQRLLQSNEALANRLRQVTTLKVVSFGSMFYWIALSVPAIFGDLVVLISIVLYLFRDPVKTLAI